ncbi:MAG: DUF58 domain-containing protein [Planctomycetes bacterium]|nr:DUF58 domain-containing protein [Planctomycetota bacterium]
MIVPSTRALRIAGMLAAGSLLGVSWPPVGWLLAMGLVALAAGVLIDGRRIPLNGVACRRRIPARLSLQEPESLIEELENLCPFPLEVRLALSVSDDVALEPQFSPVLNLSPRGRCEVTFTAVAARRGEARLSRPTLRVGFPGGLAWRQFPSGSESVLKVFPNLVRLKRYEVLRQARSLSAWGIHRARYGGLGTGFDHLRTYTRDDDYRRIHWKATARRGFPITQVVQAERGQSVLLALDVSHWMGLSWGPLSRLDCAVDAALFLAHVAHETGDRVGLVLFANEVLHFLAPSSKPGQVRRILDVLYGARPLSVHPSYRNLARYLLSRRLRRSLIVVFTEPVDSESSGELTTALSALQPKHLPLCVGFRDPALVEMGERIPNNLADWCRRIAAQEAWSRREQRVREHRKKGLKTLDVLPQALSVSLVNRYLALKNQGVV